MRPPPLYFADISLPFWILDQKKLHPSAAIKFRLSFGSKRYVWGRCKSLVEPIYGF
jgi:hypothetical protein